MASLKMSFDISEQHTENEEPLSPTTSRNEYANFVEEFMDRVSVQTIMSGSRCIGRNEARLMLAQLRECPIDIVLYDDPGVLMLDGLPVSELEEFLESGGESLEFAIRGPQPDDIKLSTDNYNPTNKKTATLNQLRMTLEKFRKTTNSEEKNRYRMEFFYQFGSLNEASKASIQPQIRSQIENTAILDAAHQETLLMTIVLPTVEEEEKELARKQTVGEEGRVTMSNTAGMSTGGWGLSAGERFRNASIGTSIGSQAMFNEARARVVSAQSKTLGQWLCGNLGSQHVWFFIAGFFLFWIFFIQTWVDYAYGEIWRALLMELLCLASLLICMMEADTQFIKMTIQERLYNYYQFLSGIEGRTCFYTFLCFLAFGKFSLFDMMAIIGGLILLSLTLTRFVLYQWSETCIDDFVITLHDSKLMREMFHKLDEDNDGYLTMKDVDNMVDPNFARCCFCRGWMKEIIFWRMDDATNDGRIDIHEFVQFCLRFRKNQKISNERRNSKKAALQQSIASTRGLI